MISNIYVKNFKAFKQADLNLSNLNVWTGQNGLGKSSLIQALLLLRQSYKAHFLMERGLQLNGEYVQIGAGRDALSMNFEGDGDNIELVFDIEWRDSGNLLFRFKYETDSDVLPLVEVVREIRMRPKALFSNQFQYLSSDRISPEPDNGSGTKLFPVSDYHVKTLKTLGKKGEYTVHYLSITDDDIAFADLAHPKARSLQITDQVSAWLGEISYGITQTSTYLPDIKAARLSYRYLRRISPNNDRETFTPDIKPQNVGFGITYVLPVITALLSAKEGDLIIIENPESHLHPAGQAAIGRLCALAAANGVQVIIETHSDHILNAVRVAVKNKEIEPNQVIIAFFERSEWEHTSEIILPKIDYLGRLDRKPKWFFDEYDKQLDNLLR